MKNPVIIAVTVLGLAISSAPAWAFCPAGDPQGCSNQGFSNSGQPFSNSGSPLQPDTTRQGYDPSTGDQWSSPSHKMGDFTFYSGMSSGNGWGNHNSMTGNGWGMPNSQNHADSFHCAYYGTC